MTKLSDTEKKWVAEKIEVFNRENSPDVGNQYFQPRFRGNFCYLDLVDKGEIFNVCRIEYTGNMENWKFAIYESNSGKYDQRGNVKKVDGTVEGAIKAGIEAYDL